MKHVSTQLAIGRLSTPTSQPLPQADMLMRLQAISDGASCAADSLLALLQARKAALQAAFETGQVADELRCYQKFAKPGQPSPQIVQLRPQQAAVHRASSRARQSFIAGVAGLLCEAGIEVPPRVALELFVSRRNGGVTFVQTLPRSTSTCGRTPPRRREVRSARHARASEPERHTQGLRVLQRPFPPGRP